MCPQIFGIDQQPYDVHPDLGVFYAGARRGEVLDGLQRAVEAGEAALKLTGKSGSGKTLLCRLLESRLLPQFEVVHADAASLAPDNILHALAVRLGVPLADSADRLHALRALQNHLLRKSTDGRRVIVFVHDAHHLIPRTLDCLRLLSHMENGRRRLLQVLLVGEPALEARLRALPERGQAETIPGFHLPSLNSWQVRDYLMFRLRRLGYSGGDPFTLGAVWLITRATGGSARKVTSLAAQALENAAAGHSVEIRAAHVRAALHETLQHARPALAQPALAGVAVLTLLMMVYALGTWQPWTSVVPQSVAAVQTALISDVAAAQSPGDEDLLAQRLDASRDWRSRVNVNLCSIQVVLPADNGAAAFVRLLDEGGLRDRIDQVYVYRMQVGGRDALGVLYGEYRCQDEGEQALGRLPAALQSYQPHLHRLRQISEPVPALRAPAPGRHA